MTSLPSHITPTVLITGGLVIAAVVFVFGLGFTFQGHVHFN